MDLDTLNYIFEDQYNTNCNLVGTLLGLIGMNVYFSSIEVIAKLSPSSRLKILIHVKMAVKSVKYHLTLWLMAIYKKISHIHP